MELSPDGKVGIASVPLAGSGTDQTSIDAVKELREDVVPDVFAGAHGGRRDRLHRRVAGLQRSDGVQHLVVLGFVFLMAFILLLVTFRSIVIPIKAIVLNLLSVGAALGIVTWVFQDGHFEGFLNFQSNGSVSSWFPLMLFVILFGLSMDYHVFILSRIKEAFDRGESTDEAIGHGIKSTAGVVTAAALVMVAVFSIFATLSFIDMKQFGVGLGVAILLDATLVRGVLLPGDDEAARRLELVPAEVARVAAEGSRARGRTGPPGARAGARAPGADTASAARGGIESAEWQF